MLRIIRNGFGSDKVQSIAKAITENIKNEKQCYLIVPEQQTVMAESEMTLRLPKNAPLYFEATNFTRFANTVFRTLGGLSGEYCDKGKRALIMWRAITELAPMLSMTGSQEVNAGLVEQSLRAVAEMESLGISADALAASSTLITEDKRLSSKLSDLSKIYAFYKKLIKDKFADTTDTISVMIEKLDENEEFLKNTNIYIDGFTSFTEAQYALIGKLAARCTVSVYLPIPKGEKDGFEYKEILKAEARLKTYANREGAEISIKKEDGRFNTSSELLSQLPYVLWKINPVFDNIDLQNSDELRIFEAATPFEECDFIASDIRRRVMGGSKYYDFAIVARSAEKYIGILDGALNNASVPYFLSTKVDISSYEAIKLIYTAFAIARNGFRREDIITYAKCGFSGISREECDELEIYTEVWQIGGSRFTDGMDWSMNPDGYSKKQNEKTAEKLIRINDIKNRLITPLLVLRDDIKAAATVKDAAEVLMRFLLDIKLEKKLKEKERAEKAIGNLQSASEISGIWKLIINSLDSMVEVIGHLPCTPDSFLAELKTLFSYASLGKIPSFVDQVTIGSADMIRLSGKKHVYLVGVNAGEFPGMVSDNSYFTDSDRQALAKAGLDIEPELEIKNARELFCFSRAFASASDSVTILYSLTDAKFKRINRSEVIDKIIKLTRNSVQPRKISDMLPIERLYSASSTINALDEIDHKYYPEVKEALINSGLQEIVAIAEGNIKNDYFELGAALTDELYGNKISLTQSRLDSYVNCPMGYFLRYTIKLENNSKRAEFDASSIGSFIHGCLENFFSELRKRGIEPSNLSSTEREDLTKKAAERYLSDMGEDIKNTRCAVKIKRLTRAAIPIIDGLCDEFSKTAFRPKFFELKIEGGDYSPDPIKLESSSGDPIYVYGIIDRVDTCEKDGNVFVRVVDYKTGSKDFSPEDMKNGRNLQMFLYLKAIIESDKKKFREKLGVNDEGKIIPSSVIYVKTSLTDAIIDTNSDEAALNAVKANQLREGMMLDTEENATLIGSEYIPGKNKRDSSKYRYTEDGLREIMQTVEGSVIRIADEIKSGKAKADPDLDAKNSPCEYCEYKPVCRNAKFKKQN